MSGTAIIVCGEPVRLPEFGETERVTFGWFTDENPGYEVIVRRLPNATDEGSPSTPDMGEPRDIVATSPMVAGPCPRCLRSGTQRNGCEHQLPNALGYIIATFEVANGCVKETT